MNFDFLLLSFSVLRIRSGNERNDISRPLAQTQLNSWEKDSGNFRKRSEVLHPMRSGNEKTSGRLRGTHGINQTEVALCTTYVSQDLSTESIG